MKKKNLLAKKRLVFCLFLCLVICWVCQIYAKEPDPLGVRLVPNAGKTDELDKAYAHYIMGVLYGSEDNPKAAIEEYLKALKYDPDSSTIYLYLSADYIKLGKYEEAIKQLNACIRTGGEGVVPHSILAFLYTLLQRFDDAAAEYQKIISANPKDLQTLNTLAGLYILQGKLKEAISVYSELSQQEVNMPLVQFNIGILYSELNNFKLAEDYLTKAVTEFDKAAKIGQMREEALLAHFYLGALYEQIGKRAQAKSHLKKALDIDPNDHNTLNYLGYMYAEDGENLDQAITMLKKAVELDSDNGAYLDSLGWAYFKKGMLKEALENLKRANELLPDPVISEHLEKVQEKINVH